MKRQNQKTPTKILVVEDEAIVAFDIQTQLAQLGYEVLATLSTGEEAIAHVQEAAPDLILLDIMLAGELNGIETAAQIRGRFDIPVIFLTAYADERTLQAAKLTEPYGYLLKPFDERELHSVIAMGLHRHQLERELKASRQWFATMLKCIGDAVIATDRHGRVAFMNAMAETLTGWNETEASGRELTEIFHIVNESTRAPVENPGLRALREGKITGLANHTVLIARNGQEFPIDDSAAPIRNERGEVIGMVLVFRDVTARKHAEDRIRRYNEDLEELVRQRAQRLQELEDSRFEQEKLAATGLMAARIAHEINQPLAGIKKSFLAIKGYVPADHPDSEFAAMILKEIDRVNAIVQQMFHLRPPEASLTKASPASEAIRQVVALTKSSAEARQIKMVVDCRQAVAAQINAEETLRQVLFNLIRNAIEASPQDSEIQVQGVATAGRLTVAVADQGSGIAEEIKTQIFEPFFTTKNDQATGGLGLGLSISKSLAEASGGSIYFQSRQDRGTTFYLSLPLAGGNGV